MKTEHSRLISCLLHGVLLCFLWPVISLWALPRAVDHSLEHLLQLSMIDFPLMLWVKLLLSMEFATRTDIKAIGD